MQPGFQSRYVEAICDQDGRNWKLLKPVDYISMDGRHFRIPEGASTDGASTPAVIWNKIPPFGDYWQSAVLHDSAYQNTLQLVTTDGESETATRAALDKATCDNLLREAMRVSGVDEVTVSLIYEGVNLCGQASFKEDRS